MGHRVAPQRAAGITRQVEELENAAQAAGKGGWVELAVAVGPSLRLSSLMHDLCDRSVGGVFVRCGVLCRLDLTTSFGTIGAGLY